MNIPTSDVKISFLNNAYNTEFHYMGTKAEWAKVSIAEKPKKAIVVKCPTAKSRSRSAQTTDKECLLSGVPSGRFPRYARNDVQIAILRSVNKARVARKPRCFRNNKTKPRIASGFFIVF